MAPRRAYSDKQDGLRNGERNLSQIVPGKSDTSPAVPPAVIYKLLGFTLAMIMGPIGSYYLTLNSIFGGNSTLAGATATVMANVVLVAYVIVAMKEDQSERLDAEKKVKKGN